MTGFSQLLKPDCTLFLDSSSRDEVMEALVDALDKVGSLRDREEFLQAIHNRERIVSTGIGMGVAIPHAKLSVYDEFFIAIAVLEKGVDWNSLDGAPVRLVFMIGGPEDRQTEYLQILSELTVAIKDEGLRKDLLHTKTAEGLIRKLVENSTGKQA